MERVALDPHKESRIDTVLRLIELLQSRQVVKSVTKKSDTLYRIELEDGVTLIAETYPVGNRQNILQVSIELTSEFKISVGFVRNIIDLDTRFSGMQTLISDTVKSLSEKHLLPHRILHI